MCTYVIIYVCSQEEDAEFKKEQDRRKKEKRERMIKKNKQRRMEKMKEELRLEEERQSKEDDHLRRMLETLFVCPFCSTLMSPPNAIYQCTDGHTLCEKCRNSGKFEVILLNVLSRAFIKKLLNISNIVRNVQHVIVRWQGEMLLWKDWLSVSFNQVQ